MAAPAPIRSFIGGISLPISVHALMLLTGNVFGISGFIHSAARGRAEALTAVAGLALGGVAIGFTEDGGLQSSAISLSRLAASGFLVGLGTRLANGCTSGHMVCGVSRLSVRSTAATAIFFTTGVTTAHIAHGNLGPTASPDWSLGMAARYLLIAQVIPLAVSALVYLAPSIVYKRPDVKEPDSKTPLKEDTDPAPQHILRHLAFLSCTIQFALALQLSGLTSPSRVVRFLLLPLHRAFDPSLAFLAAGTVPLAALLYHYVRGSEVPRLGGRWCVPKGSEIDGRLVAGAAIFGVGWGLAGICPGPGLVNFGRALVRSDGQLLPATTWLVSLVVGGLLA